ncbi:winged helix-turn-helix domain-containing protein [Erythrobacter alti]|uniref:winged helix-turn-helix domain-containing protein n=1 Tax=Erythrobacter alti TaxID=1896145 RepID=UPI0030F38B1C
MASRSEFSLEAFTLDGVLVEPAAMRLSSPHATSMVEPKVMALLATLAEFPGQLMQRSELIERLWPHGEGGDESLSRLISLLRKTLADDHQLEDRIATIRKLGYRLDATIESALAAPQDLATAQAETFDPLAETGRKAGIRYAVAIAAVFAVLALFSLAILRGDSLGASDAGTAMQDPRVSLAILPIENDSRSTERTFLAEGMTRDIISRLSRVPDMRITPYSSTRDILTSADSRVAELGARYLVSGSLSEQGDNFLLRIDLIDTESQTQIWSKRFTRPIGDFFELQDQAVQEIATAVLSEIEASEIARVRKRDTFDLNVYELVQKAEDERYRYGREPALRIVDLARRALEIDPDSRAAQTLLATQLVLNATSRYSVNREQDLVEARQLIASLRGSDPGDPEILAVAGQLAIYIDGDLPTARRLLSRALEINPNEAHTAAVLGLATCYLGDAEDGLALLRQSETRAPRERRYSLWAWFRSSCHNSQGEYAAAREAMVEAIDRNPNYAHFYYGLAFSECMEDRPRAAVANVNEARRIDPQITLARYQGAVMGARYPGAPGMSADRQFAKFARCLSD